MKSTIRLLFTIFFAQVIVTVLLFSSRDRLAAFKAEEPLLNLSLEELSEINITVSQKDEDPRNIMLVKRDDTWIMKDYFEFPISEQKLDNFRDTLFTMKKPYPVGSSERAAKQFEVTDEKYEVKVDFKKGEEALDTLYLGTSPSFKKVHARVGKDPLTYAIDFSSYELKGKDRTWINKDYLKLDRTNIKQIEFAEFTLEQNSEKAFGLSDLDANSEELLTKEVSELVSNASRPGFIDILGNEEKEEYNLKEPALQYTVTLQDGSSKTFSYGDVEEESHFILKVSDAPYYFKVSGYQVGKIKDVSRASLVKKKENQTEESAANGESSPGETETSATEIETEAATETTSQ